MLGCSRKEKNGATTSKTKTVTTTPRKTRYPSFTYNRKPAQKSTRQAFPEKLCNKLRQEALDNRGSFREVPPATEAVVDYVCAVLPEDERPDRRNAAVAHSYRSSTAEFVM